MVAKNVRLGRYVGYTTEYGRGFYSYWFVDSFGNFVRYWNAPEEDQDFDSDFGPCLLDEHQPLSFKNPEFFLPSGEKINIAIPPEATPVFNKKYSEKNKWVAAYEIEGIQQVCYLDKDCKQDPSLYLQNYIRSVNSVLPNYRKETARMFMSNNVKDRVLAVILMLVDQLGFNYEDLLDAKVKDIRFVDYVITLKERSFICDEALHNFLLSMVSNSEEEDYLFQIETVQGLSPVTQEHLHGLFYYFRTPPLFLKAWRANYTFSKVVNRMFVENRFSDDFEDIAEEELVLILDDVDAPLLIDPVVRSTLVDNFVAGKPKQESEGSIKKLPPKTQAVGIVNSELSDFTVDEKQFSEFLTKNPMVA